MRKLRFIQPHSAARPAGGVRSASTPRSDVAQRVLRLTARAWLPAALLRPQDQPLALDERVRQSGEW
jgi:hypothetical protein